MNVLRARRNDFHVPRGRVRGEQETQVNHNVLHLIGSLDRGGAESVALDLCVAIPPDEIQQTFLCLSGREGTLAPRFRAAGVGVLAPRGNRVRRVLAPVWWFLKLRPQVVQSHVSLTSGWFLMAARVMGVPVRIARVHSAGDGRSDGWRRATYRRASRWALRRGATHVLSVTEAAQRFALGQPAPSVNGEIWWLVVPNGVDLDRFHPREGSASSGRVHTMLHIGRANPAKNRSILAPLARELQARDCWRVRLVGTDDTSDLGDWSSCLEIVGPTDTVEAEYQAADVLILPSVREGLPGVVLEALASGIPVVASQIETLQELSHKLPGIALVPLDAGVGAWADAVTLMSELSARERRDLARAVAESEFSLANNVQLWKRIWRGGHVGVDV